MRLIGMAAFQTTLLPQLPPNSVKTLNQALLPELSLARQTIEREVGRALQVAHCHANINGHRIHFASDLTDVIVNLRTWNTEIETDEGQALWGRRTVKYFVFDPDSGQFAPSKFCAYLGIPDASQTLSKTCVPMQRTGMRISLYVALDETESRFDGSIAHRFLRRDLAMRLHKGMDFPNVMTAFQEWSQARRNAIGVPSAGPLFLLPPVWFR